MNDADTAWPADHHNLHVAPDDYWSLSDLGWQRHHFGLHGRIAGFRRGAEMLYESMLGSRSISDLDTVIYPYATCWRHHVELQLKSALAQLHALGDLPTQGRHHHGIQQLWQECRKLLLERFPSEANADLKTANRVITQLAAMDPDGQEFRYASRRDGSDTLPDVDQINIAAFHEAMLAVANYLDAIDTQVGEHLSTKREIDAYYAADLGTE